MDEIKKVFLYTDGACSGNPGPGGWGAILVYGSNELELSGGEKETTNNRMELTAVIEGLKRLNQKCFVTIVTDSKYVADAFNKGWIWNWMEKGWKKSDGKPVLNPDLWQKLIHEISKHEYKIEWIKGHAGYSYNERCDKMAVENCKKCLTGGTVL